MYHQPLPWRQPQTQSLSLLQLTDEEQAREVYKLDANAFLSVRARALRGLDCCVFMLQRLGYKPAAHLSLEYGVDFVELAKVGEKNISAKLLEPREVCHISSIAVPRTGPDGRQTFHTFTRQQFLSEFVDAPFVVLFLSPINGHPAVAPVVPGPNLEKQLVRDFFFCLSALGVKFTDKKLLPGVTFLRSVIAGSSGLESLISNHLLPESAPSVT